MRATWPEWLIDVMKAKDLNNKGLASLLSVSPSTVGNWLEQKHKPEAAMVSRLADLVDFQWSKLYEIIYPQPSLDSRAVMDGHIPPPADGSPKLEQALGLFEQLSKDDQDDLLAFMRLKVERGEREKSNS